MKHLPKKQRKTHAPTKPEGKTDVTVAHSDVVSNLENYLAGYNISRFIEYPDPETDELLNAYMRGYNLSLLG
ncbi:MAG: hypothetical protein ABSA97_15180 [Verrucomicrobiia bacterium]